MDGLDTRCFFSFPFLFLIRRSIFFARVGGVACSGLQIGSDQAGVLFYGGSRRVSISSFYLVDRLHVILVMLFC